MPGHTRNAGHKMPPTAAATRSAEKQSDDQCNMADAFSRQGKFGWSTVAGINFPHIYRRGKMYVSVQMIEQKILSKYPSEVPECLKHRPPLVSFYMTEAEAKLLNEINKAHCHSQFGVREFQAEKDLVVELGAFTDFYDYVRSSYPNVQILDTSQTTLCHGGWLQVNNTVVPYVWRSSKQYVPLQVIRYAAGLLADQTVDCENIQQQECLFLNNISKEAGLIFVFEPSAKLISVDYLTICKAKIMDLPTENPFKHAVFIGEDEASIPVQPPGVQTAGDVTPASGSNASQFAVNNFPPNGHIFGGEPNGTMIPPPPPAYNGATLPHPAQRSVNPRSTISSPLASQSHGMAMVGGSSGVFPYPRATISAPLASQSHGMAMVGSYGGGFSFPHVPVPQRHTSPASHMQVPRVQGKQSSPSAAAVYPDSGPPPPKRAAEMPPPPPPPPPMARLPSPTLPSTSVASPSQPRGYNPIAHMTNAMIPTMKPDQFHGKFISLMHRMEPNGVVSRVALVEALVRVCFEGVSTEGFLAALNNLCHIQLPDCSSEEEITFIQFYTLPTTQLKCKKIISIELFESCYETLKIFFNSTVKQEPVDTKPKKRKLKVDGFIDLTTDADVIEIV